MDELELELKTAFLDEAAQLLEDAEQCFLQLESSSEDPSIIENIFRLAHNLKGSGRAVGFAQMAEFTHVLESLLLKIKNKEREVTTDIVSLLLRCSDHLKNWIRTLKANMDASVDSHELISDMQNQMSQPASSQEAAAPSVEVEPSAEVVVPTETPVEVQAVPEELPVVDPAAWGGNPYPSADEFSNLTAEAPVTPEELSPPPAEAFAQAEVVAPAPAPVPVSETKPAPKAEAKTEGKTPAAVDDESIRVSLKRLEGLINNVGELVILQTVLNQQRYLIESPLLQRTIVQLAKITKDIQDTSMSLRMVPLKQTFQKMQRIVRDTSKALDKDVVLEISGEQTELDKTVVDQLGDPLVHLIRNAVDHGIETADKRMEAGKPTTGRVWLSAAHKGGQIVIEVREDGAGLDPQKLIQRATEKGVIKPGAVLSDQEAYNLIFAPGFSTKTEVTEVSGRGVGMDVVKTNIEKRLGGEIQLETELGKGTCIRISLPLTLAIIDGMVVRSGEERYIVPLGHVFESLQPRKEDVHWVSGLGEVMSLRGEQLPLYRLSQALGRKVPPRPACESIAIVVRTSERPFSFLVDDILGQQQIVIKQLGGEIRSLKGVTGGAILGDGRAALILDLNELSTRVSAMPPVQPQIKGVA